jgi:hypothetical protein
MDPLGDLPPHRAFFPSPAPPTNAPPPPLRWRLSPVPRFLFSPPFRATSMTSIGIFTLRRLTFPRGTTRLLSLLPLTMVTLLPSTNAPILRPFKSLILRRLFAHSPRSLLPSFDGEGSFSFLPQPPLLLPPTGRRLLPSRHLQFSLILMRGLPREALPGDMTLPQLRLRPGCLLSLPHLRLRPGHLLSLILSPPVVRILTVLTAPLLSSEWGVLGEWE